MTWVNELDNFLKEANFDEALALYKKRDHMQLVQYPIETRAMLRARCLVCEVLDYAGLYKQSGDVINDVGITAQRELKREQEANNIISNSIPLLKQQCWACLHLGMFYYRSHNLKQAQECFQLSKSVLTMVHRTHPSYMSLARAHYCLGLVARNDHKYDIAREHFSRSVEIASEGLGHLSEGRSSSALQYDIGKCLGLGMGWVAYTRASLSDALAHVVAARLLLKDKKIRFIHSYIDVIHACTLMSSHADEIIPLKEAISILEKAFKVLGGKEALSNDGGHGVYALRAAGELALAHLRCMRIYDKQKQEGSKKESLSLIHISEPTRPY